MAPNPRGAEPLRARQIGDARTAAEQALASDSTGSRRPDPDRLEPLGSPAEDRHASPTSSRGPARHGRRRGKYSVFGVRGRRPRPAPAAVHLSRPGASTSRSLPSAPAAQGRRGPARSETPTGPRSRSWSGSTEPSARRRGGCWPRRRRSPRRLGPSPTPTSSPSWCSTVRTAAGSTPSLRASRPSWASDGAMPTTRSGEPSCPPYATLAGLDDQQRRRLLDAAPGGANATDSTGADPHRGTVGTQCSVATSSARTPADAVPPVRESCVACRMTPTR